MTRRVRLDEFNAIPAREPGLPIVDVATRRSFADVQPRAVRWLIPGVIPRRTNTIVAGVGGLGKSTWLMAVAAQTTRGELEGGPADVIVVSYEDTIAEILRPRAEAAGADLDRIHEIVIPAEEGGALLFPRDFERLAQEVAETRARLVVVDPLLASIDVALDAHKDQHARVIVARLARLAEEHDCAITGVLHLNKAPSKDAYLRISSSTGFYNAARSVVLVVPDPEEPEEHRLIAQVKSNWSRRSSVQRHLLEEIVLPHLDPETGNHISTSRMRFLEFAEEVDRDTLLGAAPAERGERTDEAEGWLRDALGDGEWHSSRDVKDAAIQAGIAERTLQRGIHDVGVEHDRRGFPSETWWRLPQSRQPLSPTDGATVEPAWTKAGEPVTAPVAPTVVDIEAGATDTNECLVCGADYSLDRKHPERLRCPQCSTGAAA